MRSPGDVLYNFHWIAPAKVARSAQAYAGFLGPFLRHHKIRAMINLRGPNPAWRWWRSETRVCARLGIEHRDVIMSSKHLPTRSMLVALLDAFDNAAQPFLLKCSGGQDRTGFAAALYVLHVRGWNAFGEATAQLAAWPYLHWPRQNQRWIRMFFDFACEDARNLPIRHWIETVYSQERFRSWLEARGARGAFVTFHYDPYAKCAADDGEKKS